MSLVAFDFDGTLSDSEMTVLLGEQCGVADEMAAITEQAMNDELDYAESLRNRVALVEGLEGQAVKTAFDGITLRPDAAELLNSLQQANVTTAILTGGFERGVRHALERAAAEVDVIVANRLDVEDATLTGTVSGPLVEGTKDVALRALVEEYETTLAETIAIGDGANDLPMLQAAGTGIGYRPKPAVASACEIQVRSMAELESELADRGLIA